MMTSFVRFIFLLLLLGSAIAFGIVSCADWYAQKHQAADMARERVLFEHVIQHFNGSLRHGDIAVEWQKIDANQQPLETSLLVRTYTLDSEGHEVALPIHRVIIPRNRICVQGVMLNFDQSFSGEYKELRGVHLAYFESLYPDGKKPEDGLILMKPYQVPVSTQVHSDRATQFELRLWQYLWYLMDNRDQARKAGLTVTRPPVAARALANGTVYSFYMGFEGTSIVEDNDPGLLNEMLREAAHQDAQSQQ